MPGEARILAEGHARTGRDRERRPQLLVERIARRREQRERVESALHEQRYEDRAVGLLQSRGLGDAVAEHAVREAGAARAVDERHAAARRRQEAATVDADAGWDRHARVPLTGHGRLAACQHAADRLRPCETVAVGLPRRKAVFWAVAHAVIQSGVIGIRLRSAFWRS